MGQLLMENLFTAVMEENIPALQSLFQNGEANVTMPSFGKVSNNRIFSMLVHKISARFHYLNVKASHIHTQKGSGFLVSEYMLSYLFFDEERGSDIAYDTPTALLCTTDAEDRIVTMTVYTGFDAFVGRDIIFPALYNPKEEVWEGLSAAVKDAYQENRERRYEICHAYTAGEYVFVEDTALFTKGEICTPQAHLSVFVLNEDGSLKNQSEYGAIVWDFKLWPTLY